MRKGLIDYVSKSIHSVFALSLYILYRYIRIFKTDPMVVFMCRTIQ